MEDKDGMVTNPLPLPSPAPALAAACWADPADAGPASCWGGPAAADAAAPSSWQGRSQGHAASSAAPSSCPLGSDSDRRDPPGKTENELAHWICIRLHGPSRQYCKEYVPVNVSLNVYMLI